MKTNKIDGQAFGIKIIAPTTIKKQYIEQFTKSSLVKEIDKKYPNAIAKLSLYRYNDLANEEPVYTLGTNILLENNKIWNFAIDSHEDYRAVLALASYANKTSLETIEKELTSEATDLSPNATVKITKKATSLWKKLSDFFGLK